MPEKADDQKKQGEKKAEVDFGIGKISFRDLFQGIESLIDLVSKMEEEGKEEERRDGEYTSPSGRVKATYGFSVKTGLGGRPTVERFGNVRKTPQGPIVEEERQPLVDVFDEKDHVLVIIELPGGEEEHIHTEVKGETVAKIMPTFPELRGRGIVQIDGITRENAQVGIDEQVKLAKIKVAEARRITLSPLTLIDRMATDRAYLSRQLSAIPVTRGDRVQTTFLETQT